MNPNRGSFPRAAGPETPTEKRARYEAWMIETAAGDVPDPELSAILSQPNHDPTPGKKYSFERAARARCWQCVAGNDDDGARERIAQCATKSCSLWSWRPYGSTDNAESKLTRRGAVTAHCRDCQGYGRNPNVGRSITDCQVANCALWPVRPQLRPEVGDQNAFQTPFTADSHALAGETGGGEYEGNLEP